MNREIIFRAKRVDGSGWAYGDLIQHEGNCTIGYNFIYTDHEIGPMSRYYEATVNPDTAGQYSGCDLYGVKVFEGDRILLRELIQQYQTHYGDNIPRGSYTEPIGHAITSKEGIVVFKDGIFGIELEGNGEPYEVDQYDRFIPLIYMQLEFTEDHLIKCCDQKRNRDLFDNDWSEEKEVIADLMKDENVNSIPELLEYMKPKIVGTIHD